MSEPNVTKAANGIVDLIRARLETAMSTPLAADESGNFQPIAEDKLADHFQKGAFVVMLPGNHPSFVMMTKDGPDVRVNKAVFDSWARYQNVRAALAWDHWSPLSIGSRETRVFKWEERLATTVIRNAIYFDQPTRVVNWFDRLDPTIVSHTSHNSALDKTLVGGLPLAAKLNPALVTPSRQLSGALMLYESSEPLSFMQRSELLMTSQGIIRNISGSDLPPWFMAISTGLNHPLNVDHLTTALEVAEAVKGIAPLRDKIVKLEARLSDLQNPPKADDQAKLQSHLAGAYSKLSSHVSVVNEWIRYQGQRGLAEELVTRLSKPLLFDYVSHRHNQRGDFSVVGPMELKLGPVLSVSRDVPEIGLDYALGTDNAHGLQVTIDGDSEQRESFLKSLEQRIQSDNPDWKLTFEREGGTGRLIVSYSYQNTLQEDATYRFFIDVKSQGEDGLQKFLTGLNIDKSEWERARASGTWGSLVSEKLRDPDCRVHPELGKALRPMEEWLETRAPYANAEAFRQDVIKAYVSAVNAGATANTSEIVSGSLEKYLKNDKLGDTARKEAKAIIEGVEKAAEKERRDREEKFKKAM